MYTYVKYNSAIKCRQKFCDERVPSRQTIHNLNELRLTRLLIDKKNKRINTEIDLQLTFFSDEVWFGLQGYINKKNNGSCNSQNPHLTHEVWHHPGKLSLACCKGRQDCSTCIFLTEQLIAKNMCRSFLCNSFQS
jgi:hypothetical protein